MEHVFPMIDLKATGRRIKELREQRGISVRQLQTFLGFEQPQAIYKWQRGECLPSSDNLYAVACYFHVKVDEILVGNRQDFDIKKDVSCCVFYGIFSVCLLLDTSNTAKGHTPPRTDITDIIYPWEDGCKRK